jgi:hypothetical protein
MYDRLYVADTGEKMFLGVWQRIWFSAGVCGTGFGLADSIYLSLLASRVGEEGRSFPMFSF